MRMILHGMADYIGDLDEAPVILVVKRPKYAALHGLQSVSKIRYRAIPDDIGSVIQKAAVHAAMERQLDLAGLEEVVRGCGHVLRQHMSLAAAVSRRLRFSR